MIQVDPETTMTAVTLSHNEPSPPIFDALKATTCAVIQEADTKIPHLNTEVVRLKSVIQDLKRQRDDLAIQIRQYRSALAPCQFISNEILGEIFLHCTDSVAIPWDLDTSPWTISYVCGRWRSVVLGTHSLWRNIRVQDYAVNIQSSIIFDMTMEVIRRGGNRRISMAAETLCMEYPKGFSNLIATKLSCFERLAFRGNQFDLMPLIMSAPRNARELRSLEMECYDQPKMVELPMSFLESASSLQELIIRTHYPNIPIGSLLRLSLSKITVLILGGNLESDDVFKLLSRCPLIKKIEIGMQGPPTLIQSMQKARPLALPYLETLNLRINKMNPAFPSFLAALIMPRLSVLIIYNGHEWALDLTLALSHSRHLKTFRVDSSLSAADLDVLLPAVLDIECLCFKEAVLSSRVMEGIESGELLSKMEYSKFTCVVNSLDALDMHLDMLEGLRRGVLSHYRGLLNLLLLWRYNRHDPAPVMRRLHEMNAAKWDILVTDTVLVPAYYR